MAWEEEFPGRGRGVKAARFRYCFRPVLSRYAASGILLIIAVLPSAARANLTDEDKALIHAIAEANREYATRFGAIDLSIYSVHQSRIRLNGWVRTYTMLTRWIRRDDQEVSLARVPGDEVFARYVRNGDLAIRSIERWNPRLIRFGSAEGGQVRRGHNLPWEWIGNGLAARLDQLRPADGNLKEVERGIGKDEALIRVGIVRTDASPGGASATAQYDFYFDRNRGFIPVRLEARSLSLPEGNEPIHGRAEVLSIVRLPGPAARRPVYIPTSFREEMWQGDLQTRKTTYQIDPMSFRFNPELPDDFFKVVITPEDDVIDADAALQVQISSLYPP